MLSPAQVVFRPIKRLVFDFIVGPVDVDLIAVKDEIVDSFSDFRGEAETL